MTTLQANASPALPMTGADAIADILCHQGVTTVFALAGASHSLLLKALVDRGVTIIGSRHESATVVAADGYARATGRLGVALIIEEQGIPNAVGGLSSVWSAGSPVLVIAARSPHGWYDAESEYDFDSQALAKPITKWSRAVPAAERLPEYLDAAIRQTSTAPTGPVVLTVLRDFFAATVEQVSWTPHRAPAIRTGSVDHDTLSQIALQLVSAKRPLIVLGASAARDDCANALKKLQAYFLIPVMAQSAARGLLPENNISVFNWAYAYPAAKAADVVIFLGGPMSQRLGFGQDGRFSSEACYVRVDEAPAELHRFRWVDYPIQAQISTFLVGLHAALQHQTVKRSFDVEWVKAALQERAAAIAALPRLGAQLHPIEIADALKDAQLKQGFLVGDGAAIQSWMNLGFCIPAGFRFMDHFPLGSMGVGTALAIGAAAAAHEKSPEVQTILITGDGSFGYYMAELSEAVRAGLKIIVIIGNDGAWGTEYHGQVMKHGKPLNTELGPQNFAQIAAGLGCAGRTVANRKELDSALAAAFDSPVPYVIDAKIDRDAGIALKTGDMFSNALFDSVRSHSRKSLATHQA